MSLFNSVEKQNCNGVIGVLLAAGRGRRMGTTKQLLPWPPVVSPMPGQKTVVATAFDAIQPFCDDIIVVLGHQAEAVMSALQPRRYQHVSVDPDAPMFSSVMAGLSEAMKLNGDFALLHLADHPAVKPETIHAVFERSAARPDVVVMPEFNGKGGHPVLIPRNCWQPILEFTGSGGLRAFWLEHADRCVRVPVGDPGAVADLDVPEDYRSMTPPFPSAP